MSAIKDGRYPMELGGETRHLLFSLNVLDELQDEFGDIQSLTDILNDSSNSAKNVKTLLTLLLNEGRGGSEPPLDEKQVGRMVLAGALPDIKVAIVKAFLLGVSGTTELPEDDGEDDEGNRQTGEALLTSPICFTSV